MIFLNGDVVNKGDRVYHITAGGGVVVHTDNTGARVKMDSGGIMYFTDGGFMGMRKVFYWHRPAMLEPVKGQERRQDAVLKAAELLFDFIGGTHDRTEIEQQDNA